MSNINNKKHSFDTKFGISFAIGIVFVAVVISIVAQLQLYSGYRFFFVSSNGDFSTSFSMIIGIISTVIAVFMSVFIYRIQKSETERKEQQTKNEAVINQHRSQLDTIIQPLIDNILVLYESFGLFRNNAGPYILEIMSRKDSCLSQIYLIIQRYNIRHNPEYSFIGTVETLRQQAIEYPKVAPDMYRTNLVTIVDCSKCQEIYAGLENLLILLQKERSKLERDITILSGNIPK